MEWRRLQGTEKSEGKRRNESREAGSKAREMIGRVEEVD